ncbi:MAG: flagellar hook-basal body protein [Verrucomicrobia bacterium]|nr:flagellar hook-basal body protein [Verrucomicrobiota bacterium]
MNVSLYQAASALNATSRWQEVIAENLAASSLPGYKKQELSFGAIAAGRMPPGAQFSVNAPQFFAHPRTATSTSFLQGELKLTGVPTDVALEGRGFFEVQLPDGRSAYTRDGEFHLDAQGEMVTKQGFRVMAGSGRLQVDRRNNGPLTISSTGDLSQGPNLAGRIKVVDFSEPHLLKPIGNGLFLAEDINLRPFEPRDTQFHQSFLEGANTSPVTEMVNLMTAMRTFEANQRVVQLNDERMHNAITELGNP